MEWLIGGLIGFVFGFLASLMASLRLINKQFLFSIASHRVSMVVEATKVIIHHVRKVGEDQDNRSRLRDRYRYSLGPIIDELTRSFGEADFNREGPWPCLFQWDECRLSPPPGDGNNVYDRWARYDKYVRPVVQDINAFVFMDHSWLLRSFPNENREKIKLLVKLDKLCNQLERVVSDCDEALEKRPLVIAEMLGITVVIRPAPEMPDAPFTHYEKEMIRRLTEDLNELHKAWRDWLLTTKVDGKN